METHRIALGSVFLRLRPWAAWTAVVTALAACGSAEDPGSDTRPVGDGGPALAPTGVVPPPGDPPDAAAPLDAALSDPDVDAIPWETGATIGNGVAHKDTQNALGDSAALVYAGYGVDLNGAKSWATALYRAELRARGVRKLWAVQGPNTDGYQNREIGNSKVAALLVSTVSLSTKFILVLGHSSGSFVAHELLGQLAGSLDPTDVTAGKVVYFNLDGGQGGLSGPIVARLRKAYFVSPLDKATGTPGFNTDAMQALGTTYAGAGGFFEVDASSSGCNLGAKACVHVSLVNAHPHLSSTALPLDYSVFDATHPVAVAYLTAKAADAGVVK